MAHSSSGGPMHLKYHAPKLNGARRVVAPPPEVAVEGSKDWEFCLVGYFIEKQLPFSAVNTIAKKLWGIWGLIEVLAN